MLVLSACKDQTTPRTLTESAGTVIRIDTLRGQPDSLLVYLGYEFDHRFYATKRALDKDTDISMFEDRVIFVDSAEPGYWELGGQMEQSLVTGDSMSISGYIIGAGENKVRGRIRNKHGQRSTLFRDSMFYFVVNNLIDNQIILDNVGSKVKYLNIHKDSVGAPTLITMGASFLVPSDTVRANLIFNFEEDSWIFQQEE